MARYLFRQPPPYFGTDMLSCAIKGEPEKSELEKAMVHIWNAQVCLSRVNLGHSPTFYKLTEARMTIKRRFHKMIAKKGG